MPTSSIQKFFTSRDNNADSSTYVGQEGRLWWDPVTNTIYVSDGSTPGGIAVSGGGSGSPGLPLNSIQFNQNGAFAGNAGLTFDAANAVLSLTGLANIAGNVSATGNVTGNYFIGNGSQLTGINTSSNIIFNGTSNVQIATANANVTVDVNGVSNVAVFADTGLDLTGNITVTDTVDANLVVAEGGLFLNANVVVANYTIPPGYNAVSAGPITIPDGIVVDSVGSNWGIV